MPSQLGVASQNYICSVPFRRPWQASAQTLRSERERSQKPALEAIPAELPVVHLVDSIFAWALGRDHVWENLNLSHTIPPHQYGREVVTNTVTFCTTMAQTKMQLKKKAFSFTLTGRTTRPLCLRNLSASLITILAKKGVSQHLLCRKATGKSI